MVTNISPTSTSHNIHSNTKNQTKQRQGASLLPNQHFSFNIASTVCYSYFCAFVSPELLQYLNI